jgi:hypothetical protein
LARCPASTRDCVESILELERATFPESEHTLLVAQVSHLVEQELERLILTPFRPWGEALAEALRTKPSARKAAHTLRLWGGGEEIQSVVGTASQVLQALRRGVRDDHPRVTTLVEVLFSPELRERAAKPQLGLTLERIRTRFCQPLTHERGTFTGDDYLDLAQNAFGAPSVGAWFEAGPRPEFPGFLDLLLRGVRPPADEERGLAETALEVGAATLAPQPLPPGTAPATGGRLGPYLLRAELGRGGMGVVFEAWDEDGQRAVAVKLLRAVDAGPQSLVRFAREARAVARLEHENIVRVHDVGEDPSHPYLVMELVVGQTLEEWLKTERSQTEALRVAERIARALHYAHEEGVAHRDVKPANVMIDAEGRPVLMDFGLAVDLGALTRLTATGQIMGTPKYMAPEQVEGDLQAVGVASDVYSLGAVLYRALCGRAPFEAHTPTALFKKVLLDPPTPLRSLNPAVSAELEALVLRCLAKDPSDRFPTAAALADGLALLGS